jgi:hypothetical protein
VRLGERAPERVLGLGRRLGSGALGGHEDAQLGIAADDRDQPLVELDGAGSSVPSTNRLSRRE